MSSIANHVTPVIDSPRKAERKTGKGIEVRKSGFVSPQRTARRTAAHGGYFPRFIDPRRNYARTEIRLVKTWAEAKLVESRTTASKLRLMFIVCSLGERWVGHQRGRETGLSPQGDAASWWELLFGETISSRIVFLVRVGSQERNTKIM